MRNTLDTLQPNPPWVDRILKNHWDTLEKHIGKRMMPYRSAVKPLGLAELGTGHYGTVFETKQPGVVMKVTSDPSEARFVVAALSLEKWPEGIVRYYDIVRIPETYRRRPVYVIWREEAVSTGTLVPKAPDPRRPWKKLDADEKYFRGAERDFIGYLSVWLTAARMVRERYTRTRQPGQFCSAVAKTRDLDMREVSWPWVNLTFKLAQPHYMTSEESWEYKRFYSLRGPERLAATLEACDSCAELMEHTFGPHDVGAALGFYLDADILLADVHQDNIGQVVRDNDELTTVITDPGHAVFLTDRYDALLATIEDPAKLRRKIKKMKKPKRRK
jgi:hypothetical protein